MKKSGVMTCCALFSLAAGSAAWAADGPPDEGGIQWEVHGVAKNETAIFTRGGQLTNQATSTTDNHGYKGGELLKFENSLNLFINGQFTDATSMHAQLNFVHESEGTEGSKFHQDYTQNDYLRELYLDTVVGPFDVRVGKQQEVWGTADGIKLLDIINPTDYREFVPHTMADSRIPVWMIKASTPVGDNGNLQFVVSQRKENSIPGLNDTGDPNQAFIMKGVDSITGQVNGFRSVAPQLGLVAGTFDAMAKGFSMPGLVGPFFQATTVQDFVDANPANLGAVFVGGACPGFGVVGAGPGQTALNAQCLNNIAQATNLNKTNLIDGANWNTNQPNSAFEYMNNATFATFNTFVNAQTNYRRDYPDEVTPNLGLRYKGSIGGNFNYSLNYFNHYDANPYVDVSWRNNQNEELMRERVTTGTTTSINLKDSAGNYYGAVDPNTFTAINRPATLTFTEKLNRINSLGGSFDTSVETSALGPVVFRGEALYQIDTKTPVLDRTLLSQGDFVGAFSNRDTDMFKYVLGAEFIAFTNLTISGQFIQFVNLDYVDEKGNGTANSGRYTADPTVMHMDNGFQKGAEYKEFASLFLSKPVGEEQQGRVNNILMYEERGGWWNRLDAEWKINDSWVTMAEWNQYWGNADTMFGQFGKASNVQAGLKYIF